jgi:hypothetical protein
VLRQYHRIDLNYHPIFILANEKFQIMLIRNVSSFANSLSCFEVKEPLDHFFETQKARRWLFHLNPPLDGGFPLPENVELHKNRRPDGLRLIKSSG